MSYPSCGELVATVRDSIHSEDTNMRLQIPPEEAIALTIRARTKGRIHLEKSWSGSGSSSLPSIN
ncbi:hypothetical protein E2C01_043885 [Portunus trituberculatus]|uniref:Uncharacterized protein n=1 Tax=Portunus trituberculatus TaxID=210409 RepID=A0A5B7FYH9_PORTR|nr:hypothetical protein [Portunus trituberculatus]